MVAIRSIDEEEKLRILADEIPFGEDGNLSLETDPKQRFGPVWK